MHRYACRVAYDGTDFAGFQIQKDHPTIQAELERALSTIVGESTQVLGCGRTDAGVHATGYIISFALEQPLPVDMSRFCHSMSGLLPDSITIRSAAPVLSDFHPRYSCVAREYHYLIWNQVRRPAIARSHCLWIRYPLDLDALNREFSALVGHHDFAAFGKISDPEEPTQRYLDLLELSLVHDSFNDADLVRIRIRGNAFLHNMIRIIVGTILERAWGRIGSSAEEILRSRDRLRAGQTAPPHGLYLREAFYPAQFADCSSLSIMEDYPWRREARSG